MMTIQSRFFFITTLLACWHVATHLYARAKSCETLPVGFAFQTGLVGVHLPSPLEQARIIQERERIEACRMRNNALYLRLFGTPWRDA